MEKVKEVLQSRKFWALVLGLLAIAAGYSTGKLDAWQAVQAAVAALAVYSTGVALVDASANLSPSKSAGGLSAPAAPTLPAPAGLPAESPRVGAVQSTSGITGPPAKKSGGDATDVSAANDREF